VNRGKSRVPRFDRYILSQLLGHFGFFALVLVGIYWINRAIGLFDQLMSDGQSATVFLEFSLLSLPNVIKLVLPIAAFVASTYVANKLISESELVVMQATGFSAFRMARPVLYFGLIVGLMMAILANYLVPLSRTTMISEWAAMSENITARLLSDGTFTHPGKGVTLYIRDVDQTGQLRDIFLADDRKSDEKITYTARKTLFARGESGPKLIMFDGMAQTLNLQTLHLSVTRFADFTYDLGAILSHNVGHSRGIPELGTSDLLWPTEAILMESKASAEALLFEANVRFSEPFLSIAVALLGGFDRLGLWRQIAFAVGALIGLQGVKTLAEQVGPTMPAGWILAYVAPTLGLFFAAMLLWWTTRQRWPQKAVAI